MTEYETLVKGHNDFQKKNIINQLEKIKKGEQNQ